MIATGLDIKDVRIDPATLAGVGVYILAVLIGGFIVYRIGRLVITRATMARMIARDEAQARAKTAQALLLSIWKYVIGIGIGVAFVAQLPSAVVPAVALTSAVGLTIAFGAQFLFRDVIAGFSILMEGQFVVGDRIQVYGVDVQGTVEAIGLRVTVVRDDDGSRIFVPNGAITAIRNLTPAGRAAAGTRERRPARARTRTDDRGRTPARERSDRTAAAEKAGDDRPERRPRSRQRTPRGDRPERPLEEPVTAESVAAEAAEPRTPRQPARDETTPEEASRAPRERDQIFELRESRTDRTEAADGEAKPDGGGDADAQRQRPPGRSGTRRGSRGGRSRRPSRRPAQPGGERETAAETTSPADPAPAEPREVLEESPWSIE